MRDRAANRAESPPSQSETLRDTGKAGIIGRGLFADSTPRAMERLIERQPVEIGPPFGFEERDWEWFVEIRLEGKPDDEDLRIIGELSRLPKEIFLIHHNTFGIGVGFKDIPARFRREIEEAQEISRSAEDEKEKKRWENRAKYKELFLQFVGKHGGGEEARMAAYHLNRLFERRGKPNTSECTPLVLY